MDAAIELSHLTKTFDKPTGWRRLQRQPGITAVDDVNLTVSAGELFGLLGPNGAGKTTLVKILSTLITPTSGTAKVAGYTLAEASKIRQSIGLVVSDERSFYWRLSGRRNLEFFATMYRLSKSEANRRVEQALDAVDMRSHAETPFRNYSTGMKQRLAIARSILHRPQVLFLDEPSRSLDPNATVDLHDLILDLKAEQQVTVFLITHDLAEAEKICERVAVMHRGRIQIIGRPTDLRRQLNPMQHYAIRVLGMDDPTEKLLDRLLANFSCERTDGYTDLSFIAGQNDGVLSMVLDTLGQAGVTINTIEGHPSSLEEVFARYTLDE